MERVPTFKERQHSRREQEILDAVQKKLSTAGYGGFTLEEIAADVGISKPTLYLHFRSKDEMVANVGARVMNRGVEFLESFPAETPALTRLERLVDYIVEARFGPGGPVFGAEMPMSVICSHECLRTAEFEIRRRTTEIILQLQHEGLAKKEIPAMLLSSALLSLARDYRYEEMVSTGDTSPETLRAAWIGIIAPLST